MYGIYIIVKSLKKKRRPIEDEGTFNLLDCTCLNGRRGKGLEKLNKQF